MIFEQENIAFQIFDVFYLDQQNTKANNNIRNFDALSFRIESETVVTVGNKHTEMCGGSVCFFPASVNYKRESKIDKLIVIHFKVFNYSSSEIEFFLPENSAKFETLFGAILKCWNSKETGFKHKCSAILNEIFAELFKENNSAENNKSRIFPSLKYINENCMKPDFKLADMAAKSFLSEPYFRKLFKEETGLSPKSYVIDRRMKYAASLIISGYFTLNEVSVRCGYADYKHFSSEFKKIMGVSPSNYKYNYKK